MTGTEGTRGLMARSESFKSLMAWGSSSMNGGYPNVGPPLPCNIRDQLQVAIHPLPYTHVAKGQLESYHSLIHMGVTTPKVVFDGGQASTAGPAPVKNLEGTPSHDKPVKNFSCHGKIASTPGWLQGTGKGYTWAPDDGRTRVKNGYFVSDHQKTVKEGTGGYLPHHILWVGKNNIYVNGGRDVMGDVNRMVAFAGGSGQCMVVGNWLTPQDLDSGPRTTAGTKAVNEHQKWKYGVRFLDANTLLTSEWGLSSPPVKGLNLLGRSDVRADIKRGHVPRALVYRDDMHLNGWGNLIITWAMIEKMKELEWL